MKILILSTNTFCAIMKSVELARIKLALTMTATRTVIAMVLQILHGFRATGDKVDATKTSMNGLNVMRTPTKNTPFQSVEMMLKALFCNAIEIRAEIM